MLERVVVTGLGIVSCLGNDAESVRQSLFEGKSGISLRQDHVDAGMRSQIAGTPQIDLSEHIDRKQWRFMGDAAGYAYLSCNRRSHRQDYRKPKYLIHVRVLLQDLEALPPPARLRPRMCCGSAASGALAPTA